MIRRIGQNLVMPLALVALSCGVTGPDETNPKKVTDLQVLRASPGSLALRWTQVGDGAGGAAKYLIAYDTSASIDWTPVGTSVVEVAGTSVGQPVTSVVDGLRRGETYTVQLVAFRGKVDSLAVFGEPSNVVSGTVEVDSPGIVNTVQTVATSATSVTATWTQVDNGAGLPANYVLAIGTTSISWPTARATAQLIPGTAIGTSRSASFSGLTPGTNYVIQLAVIPGAFTDTTALATLSSLAPVSTPALGGPSPYFADDFDTGNRSNGPNFTWGGAVSRVVVSTDVAFSGAYSLRFRFGPDAPGGDSSAEQRFTFVSNVTELWIDYMLFVPPNYIHRNDPPTNNKFIRIWGDAYASANKVGASTLTSTGGSSTLGFEYNFRDWPDGTLGFGPDGGQSTKVSFGTDAMRGKWTRIRHHFRMVSAVGANDALMQMWVDDALAIDFQNVGQKYDTAKPYWNQGYLFGWSNSGFASETFLYVDNLRFFVTNPGW